MSTTPMLTQRFKGTAQIMVVKKKKNPGATRVSSVTWVSGKMKPTSGPQLCIRIFARLLFLQNTVIDSIIFPQKIC